MTLAINSINQRFNPVKVPLPQNYNFVPSANDNSPQPQITLSSNQPIKPQNQSAQFLNDEQGDLKEKVLKFLSKFNVMWIAFVFGTVGDFTSAIVENNVYKNSKNITQEERFNLHCKKASGSVANLLYWVPVLGIQKLCYRAARWLVGNYPDQLVADKAADAVSSFISLLIGFPINEGLKTVMEAEFTKWMLNNAKRLPKPYLKFFGFNKDSLLKTKEIPSLKEKPVRAAYA